MELIYKEDALHAVLHHHGDAAVAAVQAIKPLEATWDKVTADRCKLPTLIRDICERCRDYKYCHRPITLFDALRKEQTDALEAAEQRIAELEAQNELKDGTITAMATDIGKLRAQLPKEGEWMKNIRWNYQQPSQSATINVASQSATINVGTTFLCRSTGKPCPNATQYGYCKQTVCTIDSARE